jgi:hypothetical protein
MKLKHRYWIPAWVSRNRDTGCRAGIGEDIKCAGNTGESCDLRRELRAAGEEVG